MKKYDALVIGSGQAGNPLAHNLADQGWNVALVEREHLGGSCINTGCTPTKTMLASARAAYLARRAADFGVELGKVEVDLKKVSARKDRIVQSFRQGQEEHIQRRENLHLYRGEAVFREPYCVQVDGQTLTSEKIFINTGTSPRVLPVPGLEKIDYLTNRTILELQEIPEHLLVLGGSYVGLEFAQMFRRFGSKVTVIEASGQIAAREDGDVAQALQEILEREGIRFYLRAKAKQVERSGSGELSLEVEQEAGQGLTLRGSHLLLAAGRTPNTAALNLDAASIEHEQGYIRTNEFLETNQPGVYGLGDVKGGPAFTHLSYNDFQIVYHNLFHPEKQSIRERLVPYALYTDPELGRVGMTETEARQAGKKIKVGKASMEWVARAIERGETQGFMKIVVDAETDQVLGAAILGMEGGELVQTLMVLMMAKAPWTLLHKAVFIHPTLSEGFFGLMDAVEGAEVQ